MSSSVCYPILWARWHGQFSDLREQEIQETKKKIYLRNTYSFRLLWILSRTCGEFNSMEVSCCMIGAKSWVSLSNFDFRRQSSLSIAPLLFRSPDDSSASKSFWYSNLWLIRPYSDSFESCTGGLDDRCLGIMDQPKRRNAQQARHK